MTPGNLYVFQLFHFYFAVTFGIGFICALVGAKKFSRYVCSLFFLLASLLEAIGYYIAWTGSGTVVLQFGLMIAGVLMVMAYFFAIAFVKD